MGKFIELWIINALSLWVIDQFSASITFAGFTALAVTSFALTILNQTIRPLLRAISAPLNFITLGLFSFVINGLVLWAAFRFSDGSIIRSFGAAVWISILLALLNGLFEKLFDK